MNTDSTTLYKLMILYMLSKVNFPLSNTQLSSFMLDKQYTDYFTFQETINSLVEDSGSKTRSCTPLASMLTAVYSNRFSLKRMPSSRIL